MKSKTLKLLLGLTVGAMLTSPASIVTMASETEVVEETAAEDQVSPGAEVVEETSEETDPSAEADVETPSEEEQQEAEESESDFQEGSAVLSDYDYEAGEMNEDGWESKMLNMKYDPESGITTSAKDKENFDKYYERNGKDKQVAASELVVLNEDGGFMQMSIEVNPNRETSEDVLNRFSEEEGLDLASKPREITVADKTFLSISGVVGKEKYLLAVSTDEDDYVLAIMMKYSKSSERKAFLAGFDVLEEEEAEEAEDAEENGNPAVSMNSFFSEAAGDSADGAETDDASADAEEDISDLATEDLIAESDAGEEGSYEIEASEEEPAEGSVSEDEDPYASIVD